MYIVSDETWYKDLEWGIDKDMACLKIRILRR
jgi:hypothetical protein